VSNCKAKVVGDVEVRNQAARLDDRDQLGPLRGVQVHSGGVVATGVHEHDAAFGNGAAALALEGLQHACEVQCARGSVVIRVGVDGKARAFKHGAVVVPGRVADPHIGVREVALQKVAADFQAARAADGLHRGDALA
jgi:acyl CoA:acetate/3-ketoacid CoA transferase